MMSNEKSLGGTWVSFCWVCAAEANIYGPHLSHFWANM